MEKKEVVFPSGKVDFLFEGYFTELDGYCDLQHAVVVTDEHIARLHKPLFKGLKTVVVPAGEQTKDIHTLNTLARQLLELQATRQTMLIGVGGGVITDITGFLASVYMRGVPFGFVPTSLLAMADAAVGGKNGVNVGMHKNILGMVRQPQFILYDSAFLETLPEDEWSNGFAEIIKYGCIFDQELFDDLGRHSLAWYRDSANETIGPLIRRCVEWKVRTVQEDERENGVRKLLNFGHTAAHAIENLYDLPHGKAVAIGMIIACMISEHVAGLDSAVTSQLRSVLVKYQLPVRMKFDPAKALELLVMDKKRVDDHIDYIMLERAGKAVIRALPIEVIAQALEAYERHN